MPRSKKVNKDEFEVKIWGKNEDINIAFHTCGFQTEVLFGLIGAILGYSRKYDIDYGIIKKMLKEINKNFKKCDLDDLVKIDGDEDE